jgi:hypothetical protein
MTQGIERYHRSLKNQILSENYYLPGQLAAPLAEFVAYYNNHRYHLFPPSTCPTCPDDVQSEEAGYYSRFGRVHQRGRFVRRHYPPAPLERDPNPRDTLPTGNPSKYQA